MTRQRKVPWEVVVFRAAVRLLGGGLGRSHGSDIIELFRDRLSDVGPDAFARLGLLVAALADLLRHGGGAREDRERGAPRSWLPRLQDVRFAARSLLRRPLFTALALAALALGIGGSTAVFSVVDGVLLRRLPYRDPESLVSVWRAWPSWRGAGVLDYVWDHIHYPAEGYLRIRENARTLAGVEAVSHQTYALTEDGRTGEVTVGVVTAGLFDLVGVRPAMGRSFRIEETLPAAETGARVALLSHETWSGRFGGDPAILGRSIRLRGEAYQVVGVLPPGFRVVSDLMTINDRGGAADSGAREVWLPMGRTEARCGNCLELLARLAPGRTLEQARAELQTLVDGMEEGPDDQLARVERRREYLARGLDVPLLTLFGASGILLLVACLNVAGLLVGEAPGRRQEIQVRLALGAGRRRVVGQLLTESALLGVAGSVAGLLMAWIATEALLQVAPPLPRIEEVGMSLRVFGFAVAAGLATGLLFGLAPTLSLLTEGAGASRSSTPGRRTRALHAGVVTVEVALSVMLLVAGGLFSRSLGRLFTVDPGFDPNNLAVLSFTPPTGTEPQDAAAFQGDVLRTVRGVPGVRAAALAAELPFPGGSYSQSFRYERDGIDREATLWNRAVTAGFLEMMGIPLLEGRSLSDADGADAARVAVVSRSLADQLWPGESPLGRTIRQGGPNGAAWEVVGVVGDVRHKTLAAAPEPTFYRTTAQYPTRRLYVVARTDGEAASVLPAIERAIWGLDPSTPVAEAGVMASLMRASEADDRFRAILVAAFAVLAGLLAGVGIFGVTARSVAVRARELGIRSALGASASGLVRLVLADGLRSALPGVALGLAAAAWTSGVLRSLLYGVDTRDPLTYAVVACVASAAYLLAAYVPARRATRVDPRDAIAETT
jgi:predicted permease